MRCHYDVLALERDASAKEVKKAFHVQALRWHPDKHQKNNISSEEATLRFQEIQSAYEVLSDAHERKWYDDHREQILRGDADNDGDDDGGDHDGLNLFKYFRCVLALHALASSVHVTVQWVENLRSQTCTPGAVRACTLALAKTPRASTASTASSSSGYVAISCCLALHSSLVAVLGQPTVLTHTCPACAWPNRSTSSTLRALQLRRAVQRQHQRLATARRRSQT